MNNNNNNTIFVVTYQDYLYGDEYEDIKRVMGGFEVKGAFSTKKKAKDFIEKDIEKAADNMFGDDDTAEENDDIEDKDKFIEEYESHYSIYKLKVDGQS